MKTKIPREEHQRVEKKKLILPIFIVSLLVLSVFGYLLGSAPVEEEETLTFGDYHFYKNIQGWNVRIDEKILTLVHLPDQVQDLSLTSPIIDYRSTPKVYVSSIPSFFSSIAFRDLYTNLLSSQNFQVACTQDISGCEQYPLKTCADASAESYILLFEPAPENSYAYTPYCLQVKGTDSYFVRVADRFLFEYFHIL